MVNLCSAKVTQETGLEHFLATREQCGGPRWIGMPLKQLQQPQISLRKWNFSNSKTSYMPLLFFYFYFFFASSWIYAWASQILSCSSPKELLSLERCLSRMSFWFFCFFVFSKVWDGVSGDELITLAHKHIVKSVDFTQVRSALVILLLSHLFL